MSSTFEVSAADAGSTGAVVALVDASSSSLPQAVSATPSVLDAGRVRPDQRTEGQQGQFGRELCAGRTGQEIFGGNENNGNYSVGLGDDVFQKYRFDLKYIDYLGRYRDNGTAVTTQNGFTTLLKDRGFVSLTFKTTF